MTITAAADGSALGNPGPAGWAWYIDDDTWAAGGWAHGTNNMGELMSVLDLLRQTAHAADEPLHVLCDSVYAINVISKWTPGWKRKGWRKADGKPVLNLDLVKALDEAMQGRRVSFEWVKGHAGHPLNEAADERARAVALAYQAGRDFDGGPGFPGATAGATAGALPPQLAPTPPPPAPVDLFSQLGDPDPRGDHRPPPPVAGQDRRESPPPLAVADLDPDVAEVVALERSLLPPSGRRDPARLDGLLHPDFCQIHTAGRLENGEGPAEYFAPGSGAELVQATEVRVNTVLLVWRSNEVMWSSLWLRTRGRWQMRFRQATPR